MEEIKLNGNQYQLEGSIMHTLKYVSITKIEVIVDDTLSNDIINELLKQLTRGSNI